MRSVMTHQFSQVPKATIPRSSFNRSHGVKTTFDAGYLIPIYVDEALPGDTFNLRATAFARLATPLKPFMDNLFIETFFFAVPNRLVWDNWQKFCGEQDNPDDSVDFTVPQNVGTGAEVQHSTLFDYMGLPTGFPAGRFNFLHIRAYHLIYNEWFRDQNLIDSFTVATGDGPDSSGNTVHRRRKRHDYFTSCLPWPQKGDTVDLPLGQIAPVVADAGPINYPTFTYDTNPSNEYTLMIPSSTFNPAEDRDKVIWADGGQPQNDELATWGAETGLVADLSNATASTINELRQAFQIQKLLERDARGGTRYTEIIRSHFGVTSPDARLQRPEFLGGGSAMININPVEQTTPEDTTPDPNSTPQGNLAAYGTASFRNHGFTKSFTEHCCLIGLVNVRADLTYQQGLNRMWSRQIRYDYYWPALAMIGEQAVLNKEIYAQGSDSPGDDDLVFGYQERFAEYRYKPSQITGLFRSYLGDGGGSTLDFWHLSQNFESLPLLNQEFIEDDPPIDRVIAVPSEPHFLLDMYIHLRCARPMPLYGTPGLIDHF